jgi:MoxR-like ATPase
MKNPDPSHAHLERAAASAAITRAREQVQEVILGQAETIKKVMVALLAGGHVLLDDVPGLGKTTLAHAVAVTLGLEMRRVQFTADLMPADIVGVSIYERSAERFCFHPGPVFTQVLLADEINRASPRTQSALLEAMAERQVTVDGQTRALPKPFFVLATQNPVDMSGTFPLPESQLDRFLMRLKMGYPGAAAERALLLGEDPQLRLARLIPVLRPDDVLELQATVRQVHVSVSLAAYVQRLLEASRAHPEVRVGVSPRGGLGLLQAARAYAAIEGRAEVLPSDVQAIFESVCAHRLITRGKLSCEKIAQHLLQSVDIED